MSGVGKQSRWAEGILQGCSKGTESHTKMVDWLRRYRHGENFCLISLANELQ